MTDNEGPTVVRPAGTADSGAIAEVSDLLGYPTSARDLARRLEGLDPAENLVLVLERAGEMIGWVHVFRSHRLEEDPFAELGGLIVAPDHRGLGLGRELMEAGEEWVRRNGCSMLRIRSHEKRTEAHRFYEKISYQRVKRQQVLDKDLGRKRRMRRAMLLVAACVLVDPGATSAEEGTVSPAAQILGATAAAPEDRREGAEVLGYDEQADLVVLRPGSNELICIADTPGDELFRVACYHRSLEPYMVRGRELRAEGLDGAETINRRHTEADAGSLKMPDVPASLYNLGGPLEIFDPETGAVSGGSYVWSIYTPYATAEETGLPTTPQAPGAPWIMRPGTASSHIMVVQPREPKPKEEPAEGGASGGGS